MIRGYVRTLAMLVGLAALTAAPAFAGTIALTGHDDDFHCDGGPGFPSGPGGPCAQLGSLVSFVTHGSALPVLVFDEGTEMTSSLTSLGVSFTNVSTAAGITASLFDNTKYSAFIVASDESCGGCDNTAPFEAAIAAQNTAIDNFFNNGGGILGMTSGANSAYYNFVPQVATSSPIFNSTGFVATGPSCTAPGFTAVNGDETHNTFSAPGTAGTSPFYCTAEFFDATGAGSGPAVTLLLSGGTIVTDVITTTGGTSPTPEPATLALLGIGMCGAAVRRRFRSKK